MKPAKDETAAQVYAKRRREALSLLARIGAQLDVHDGTRRSHPTNWGYPGDLGAAIETLRDALRQVGGTP